MDRALFLARVPRQQRTLTGLTAFVQNNELRQVLRKYTMGNPGGMLLDADHDTADTGFWRWYELSVLMRMPSLLAPVLTCLFHKLQRRLTGAPTVIVIDEGWVFWTIRCLPRRFANGSKRCAN